MANNSDILLKTLVVGPLQVNSFLVGDLRTSEVILVDPGDEPDRIIDIIKDDGLRVESIVCTHGHFDHVGAIPELKEHTSSPVVLRKDEMEIYTSARDMAAVWGYKLDPMPVPDTFVSEGDEIRAGGLLFKVLESPGHSPGGICLYGNGVVITGDTLFAGSVGRTDFYGGDIELLKKSFNRLLDLPEETEVLPGHGPATTIGREREENFFVHESGWEKNRQKK